MNKILFSVLAIMVFNYGFGQKRNDWANFSKYEEANKTTQKNGVVFIGNSITEGWAARHPDFFVNNNYIGRGISGQVSSQMLVRFRQDVINLKPKAVVIFPGTNDIAQNNGYISLPNVMQNIISMCELAKAHKIKVILCSVLPAYEFGWRKELKPADEIIDLNKLIKSYAIANQIIYVDFHTALRDERNGLPEKYAADGVHPTIEAYLIMEKLVSSAIAKTIKK
ncbi:MAG TPA: SGNH/GDSL hydrolase family protein [Niabella sp.]|nr:SGNH/GDSL hydrolase family protein [Niabella sp.]HRO84949.1 SGNH/GDSL hydrolase family protein [Niabella sp.]